MNRTQRRARMRKPLARTEAARHAFALKIKARMKRAIKKILLNSTYGKLDAQRWNVTQAIQRVVIEAGLTP